MYGQMLEAMLELDLDCWGQTEEMIRGDGLVDDEDGSIDQ